MPPVGFEPTVPAGERPQTYALRLRGYWDRHTYIACIYYYSTELLRQGENIACCEMIACEFLETNYARKLVLESVLVSLYKCKNKSNKTPT